MNFNFLHKEDAPSGLCCLYLMPDKLVLTQTLPKDQQSQKNTVTFIETSNYESNHLKLILDAIVKKHALQNMACSVVLHSSFYQLFLLNAPAVAETEIAQALRWQIQELINFPADEAVIQYFPMPSMMPTEKKIYVVISKKAQLQAIADVVIDVKLKLKFMDIPELALRNICALYGDESRYLAFLAFNQEHIELIVTKGSDFLLSRRLALPGITNINAVSPEWLNELSAEIQNSFVYAKSHYHQELPQKLLVLTAFPELVAQLNQLLKIEIEQLMIEKKINFELVMPTDNYFSLDKLIAIGGALRSE